MEREKFDHIVGLIIDGFETTYSLLRTYFLTGVILVVPVAVTLFIIFQLFVFADGLLGDAVSNAIGTNIPGVGLIFTVFLLILSGMIAQNVLGKRLIRWVDYSLESLPIVRSLYVGVKQVSEILFQNKQGEFQKVVFVEYPKEASWTLAFVTGELNGSFASPRLPNSLLCVFVPTTPNPTSGFMLIVDSSKVIEAKLSIEEAMKMIISGGLIKPLQFTQLPPNVSFEDFTIPH
ncbi:DUF502 domain-containing protein [bacterium]|nr:DUF502 domain-containing protein [bacterium]